MSAIAEERRKALRASRLVAKVLVIGAFALSAVALWQLATAAHIPPWLAWIWPVCIDGSIYQATRSVDALAGRKEPEALAARKWFQRVIGGGVVVSVAANGLHAWMLIGNPLTWWQITIVAIVPPILLLVATHGVTVLAGLDVLVEPVEDVGLADEQLVEIAEPPHRITVERVEPVEQVPAVEVEPVQAIEARPEPELPVQLQQSLDAAKAGQSTRRPATTQRDPAKVTQAQELAAAGASAEEIARQLAVSTRTVRRYLRVEIEETTVGPPTRPQLFAVDNDRGLEVING